MGHLSPLSRVFSEQRAIWLAWSGLLLLTVVAYWPGLNGPFMLDDYSSIARLGDFDGVRDWETFKAFVFQGTSGPTGRPLSLLSFLIDGNNWPTDAKPFKRTNLIIHLVNGVLLGVLVTQVLVVAGYEQSAVRKIAFVAVAVWLLHPFLVSTTLYAVQRMAQLSTLFMLAGCVVWMRVRMQLSDGGAVGYLKMTAALAVFGLLAILSKENGILLPLLIGCFELTVFASAEERYGRIDRRWMIVFVLLPLLVILAYLGERLTRPNFFEIVPPRDFTIYERLLTQPRILVDYLYNWFVPKLYTTGVFQDHFIKSTSLTAPLSTLFATLFVVGATIAAGVYRRRWPLLSLAVLFFVVNHLLESTVINLELYFEHRNYLAVVFLFVPLLVFLQRQVRPSIFAGIALIIVGVLFGFTRYSATVWSTYESIVQASATKAPTSARAQSQYASILFNAGRPDEAMRVLDEAIEAIPGQPPILLVRRLIVQCNRQALSVAEFRRVALLLGDMTYDARMLRSYNNFAKGVVEQRCPTIQLPMVLSLFKAMLEVPQNSDPTSIEYTHLKFLVGYVYIYMRDTYAAMAAFKESLDARPGASYAMAMAALFATSGYPYQALELSEIALTQLDTANNTTLIGRRAKESDIREFQRTIRAELQESNSDQQAQ